MKKHQSRLITVLLALAIVLGMAVGLVAAERPTGRFDLDGLESRIREIAPIRAYETDEINGARHAVEPKTRLVISLAAPAASKPSGEAAVIAAQQDVQRAVLDLTGAEGVFNEVGYLENAFSVNARRSDLAAIRDLPGVRRAEEAVLFEPDLLGAVKMTEADRVWEAPYLLKGEGMVVAVIDTGIDIEHEAMRLTDPSAARLGEAAIEALVREHGLPGGYASAKVPYGFDYADHDADFKDHSGREAHGMHVAGIIAANAEAKDGVRGVAPEAQLLAMKVFSDQAGGAYSDDISVAIKDAVTLGADVINMSLGSPGGFSSVDSALSRIITGATDAGVSVCISAGNEGSAYDKAGLSGNDLGLPDNGIVGSDSTHPDAISVASVNNVFTISEGMTYRYAGAAAPEYLEGLAQPEPEGGRTFLDGTFVKVVPVAWEWGTLNTEGQDLTGCYALLMRNFWDASPVAAAVKDAGGIGLIVYDQYDQPEELLPFVAEGGISSFYITLEDGERLIERARDHAPLELNTAITTKVIETPDPMRPSYFTSWGPTPELTFKPEIAAPGGNIYSTLNDNTYGGMSGTSMASPHMAAICALIAEANPDLSGRERTDYIKTVTMNTAQPLTNTYQGGVYSPRQVGAGAVNVRRALDSEVTVAFSETGKAAVELKNDVRPFELVLKNRGEVDATFAVEPGTVYTGVHEEASYAKALDGATATASAATVTVPAGGERTVTVTLGLPADFDKNFVEGYVTFTSQTEDQPDLSIPYLGYVGDWGMDFAIFDTPEGMPNPLFPGSTHSTYVECAPQPFWYPTMHYVTNATSLQSYHPFLHEEAPLGNSYDWAQGVEALDLATRDSTISRRRMIRITTIFAMRLILASVFCAGQRSWRH